MTVQSPSEDCNSSDDVYSSVQESSDNNGTLNEAGYHIRGNDKLGPLPAVPNRQDANNNSSKTDNEDSSVANDKNNNYIKAKDMPNITKNSRGKSNHFG